MHGIQHLLHEPWGSKACRTPSRVRQIAICPVCAGSSSVSLVCARSFGVWFSVAPSCQDGQAYPVKLCLGSVLKNKNTIRYPASCDGWCWVDIHSLVLPHFCGELAQLTTCTGRGGCPWVARHLEPCHLGSSLLPIPQRDARLSCIGSSVLRKVPAQLLKSVIFSQVKSRPRKRVVLLVELGLGTLGHPDSWMLCWTKH